MISKRDWNDALDAWTSAERERLGGPLSPEDVVAFKRGDLPPAEAARVHALLAYDRELAPLLDDTTPRASFPLLRIAAILVVALLGGALVESRWELRTSREPYVATPHVLTNRQSRGASSGASNEIPAREQRALLAVTLSESPQYDTYRLDLVDLSPKPKIVWSAGGVRPFGDGFAISVGRAFLHHGAYRVDVYGLPNGRATFVESFPFRVR